MEAVSRRGGRSRPPALQSWAARLGVLILVCPSIQVGARYWWERDPPLAAVTIGAELIAFAGLGVVVWQWGRSRRLATGALLVTMIAAAWCGFTMFQKIQADGRQEAIDAARERPAYVFAQNAAQTAERLLTQRLRFPNPRPECACPQTINAWEAAEASAINRLRNERDDAVLQMDRAMPVPELDRLALARGLGVEIVKLLGLVVFSLALGPPRKRRPSNAAEPSSIAQPRQTIEVIEGGLSTSPPTIPQPTQPKHLPLWLRLKNLGVVIADAIAAQATQPALGHSAITTTGPANQPTQTLVERDAAPIAWSQLGDVARDMSASQCSERRIAQTMTTRYGEKISRHQVRIWLGRERRAA